RNPLARATATNAFNLQDQLSSRLRIVHKSAHTVWITPDYHNNIKSVICGVSASIMLTVIKGTTMTCPELSNTYSLGELTVRRLGYGAMQLAGPGVFGPPKDHQAAIAVLQHAVASGVNHIDTSDFYGPHITNQLIREALSPYQDDLVIVTKIGAVRGDDASWNPALSREALTQAVHDNLRNLGLDVLDVVNFRCMISPHGLAEG